ncbi:MAG: hypothetical protein SFZ03_06845 [Candidatus Melainabacteria bacterium]|nr:hypothetical protein [Candidatus Melainabacteria bacterium]
MPLALDITHHLETLRERLQPERLQALLLWLAANTQEPLDEAMASVWHQIDETPNLPQSMADVEECYRLLTHLALEDMVTATLVSEFGLQTLHQPRFQQLAQQVISRLSHHPKRYG